MGWQDYLPKSSEPKRRCITPRIERRTACSVPRRTACSVPNGKVVPRRPKLAACYVNGDSSQAGKDCCLRVTESLCTLGSAQETDFAHAQRHPVADLDKWAMTCQRCLFRKWTRQQNSFGEAVPKWLVPKPSFMKGAWGLGCIVCAAGRQSPLLREVRRHHMATNKSARRCKQAISRSGKFAFYESRGFRNIKELNSHIKQHSSSDMHRLCSKFMDSGARRLDHIADPRKVDDLSNVRPFAVPLVAPTKQAGAIKSDSQTNTNFASNASTIVTETIRSKVGSIDDPFRGRVPQCKDWLHVWADYTSTLSGRKQVSLAKKKIESATLSRTTRTRMLAIMARVR
jgi:hypothetical protein